MRCCLVGGATLVAMLLVVAALWYGVVGLLSTNRGWSATLVAGIAATETPPVPTRSATRPLPMSSPPRPIAVASPRAGEVALVRLTDTELTAALQQALPADEAGTLEDARVRVTGGGVEVTGVWRGLAIPIDVLIAGQTEVRDGRPAFRVERVEGVGVPLPDTARQQLEAAINRLALVPVDAGVTLTRIEPGEGELTVYGRRS